MCIKLLCTYLKTVKCFKYWSTLFLTCTNAPQFIKMYKIWSKINFKFSQGMNLTPRNFSAHLLVVFLRLKAVKILHTLPQTNHPPTNPSKSPSSIRKNAWWQQKLSDLKLAYRYCNFSVSQCSNKKNYFLWNRMNKTSRIV